MDELPVDSEVRLGAAMLKTVKEINVGQTKIQNNIEILGKNLMNTKVAAAATTADARRVSAAKLEYNVEILAVIDYATYRRFECLHLNFSSCT